MTRPGRRPGSRHRFTPGRPVALCALILGLATAGCGSAAATGAATTTSNPADPWVPGLGGTLTVGIDQAPTGCNPNLTAEDTWANQLVLEPVLPSAFVIGPGGSPSYDSAVITQAEVVSTTPQTVVYTINPKAVWSDGTPITATDFLYAWHEQRAPAAADAAQSSTLGYRDIRSVKATNHGRTVTVIFKTPFADWQMLFDDLLPAHVMASAGWDPGCTTVDPSIDLSGGPYEIGSVSGKEIVLVRNPRWWGQEPYLDRIVVRVAAGSNQLANWVDRGSAEVVQPSTADASFLAAVATRPRVDSASAVSTTFLQLEYSTTSPVTGDLNVRLGVSHALDRQAMVNAVVGPTSTAVVPAESHLYSQAQSAYPGPRSPSIQVSGAPGYTPPPTSATPTPSQPFPLDDDPTDTVKELTAAGYQRDPAGTWVGSDGKPLTLRVVVDTSDSLAVATSAVVVHQLSEAGIATTVLDAPDTDAAGGMLAAGTADAAVLPFAATPYPSEAIAWYTPVLGTPGQGGSENWSNLDDATVTSTLSKAAQELNPVDASPMYAQADALLWQQMVALPLFAEPTALAWSMYTSGVGPNPNGAGLLWSPETWGIRVPATSPDTAPG